MAKNDWVTLEAEFIASSMTLRQFADSKGIKPSTVMMQASKRDWDKKREQKRAELSMRASEKRDAVVVGELAKFNEDDLKVAKAIRSQVASSIKAAQESKTPIHPVALRALAGAAEVSQRMGRLALGASTSNTQVDGQMEVKSEQDLSKEELEAELAKHGITLQP